MWILRRFSKDGFSAQFLTQRFSRSFSKDFPPIFRNVEVWLVQKFQINFSIFTHFMRNFGSMSYNGKGLCEVRATANRKSGGEPISSKNHFHFFKFTKKNEMVFCGYFLKYFWDFLQPRILQNPCCTMFFIHLILLDFYPFYLIPFLFVFVV